MPIKLFQSLLFLRIEAKHRPIQAMFCARKLSFSPSRCGPCVLNKAYVGRVRAGITEAPSDKEIAVDWFTAIT